MYILLRCTHSKRRRNTELTALLLLASAQVHWLNMCILYMESTGNGKLCAAIFPSFFVFFAFVRIRDWYECMYIYFSFRNKFWLKLFSFQYKTCAIFHGEWFAILNSQSFVLCRGCVSWEKWEPGKVSKTLHNFKKCSENRIFVQTP